MSKTRHGSPSVVITGASTGIGEACARELDRRGFLVFAGVRDASAAERLQAGASDRLVPLSIDVTDTQGIAAAAQRVTELVEEAGLDGLVNNAGIAVAGPLEAMPLDALRRQLDVNVVGQVAVTQAMLPLLRKARGRVVNMSSSSGGVAVPCLGAYSASKWAFEAINDTLRQELRPWGIRVSSVAPGPTKTPIWEKSALAADENAKQVPEPILAQYKKTMAMMREMVDRNVREASPVDSVVEAVVHALTAERPKTHYYIGWSTRLTFKGMKMLSDGMRDWIVGKATGVS